MEHFKSNEHKSKLKPKQKVLNYKCDKCDFKSNTSSNLNRHKTHKHGRKSLAEIMMAGDEDDELLTHLLLQITVSEVHGIKVYKCSFCDYETHRKDQMKDHVKRRHLKEKPKHECSYCERTFSTEHNLRQHTKIHRKRQTAEMAGPHPKKARTEKLETL